MVDGSGDEARRVLPESQATLVTTLRPYANFEAQYQGKVGLNPIMFTPDGAILDPQAGQPGYSPQLVAGMSVPLAARIVLWLPLGNILANDNNTASVTYNWTIIWRIRSVADYRRGRIPFHYPRQGPGVTTTAPDPGFGPRFIMPCAYQSIVYTDPGSRAYPFSSLPGPYRNSGYHTLAGEKFQPPRLFDALGPPLNPGAVNGVVEQGIVPPAIDNYMPGFVPVDVIALGDDMLLACTKAEPNAFWDFSTGSPPAADNRFATLFGHGGTANTVPLTAIGVYVSVVVAT